MKVDDKRKSIHEAFSKIETGDVFLFAGDVYMKMELLVDADVKALNSVNLSDGTIECINDNTFVELVNAKVVLE